MLARGQMKEFKFFVHGDHQDINFNAEISSLFTDVSINLFDNHDEVTYLVNPDLNNIYTE